MFGDGQVCIKGHVQLLYGAAIVVAAEKYLCVYARESSVGRGGPEGWW